MATKTMHAQSYDHVPLDKLMFDPRNARVHPEANIESIRESLRQYGQTVPLVVQRATGEVISGNGRLQAMRDNGMPTAQVLYVDWDDAKARAYALVDNRTAETSEWDFAKLAEEAQALAAMGVDLEPLGFDEDFMHPVLAADWKPDDPDDDFDAHQLGHKHGKPVQLTPEQRQVFDTACTKLRGASSEDYSEGRCLELMAADYMAG